MASSPLRRLCHWGPIAVLAIIKLITWAMVHLMSMWWPPHASLGGALHAATFLGFAGATLYFFLQALLEGPGFVPIGWKPKKEEDKEFLQFCIVCNGYKAPRSHHCRKCGRCVMKMDHHCPWINCCVGHANHCYFLVFLCSAVVGCFHAAVVLSICVYHAINRVWYIHNGTGREPMIYLTLSTLLLTLLAVGMAAGVVLAVGALLYFQVKSIINNRTTIEDWILEKAISRHEVQGLGPFVYPYDLGWKSNVWFVLRSGNYDGLSWPVRSGCGEYDLTREQQAQKQEKRLRSRVCRISSSYSGRWVPMLQYSRAALSPPCTDEPRLPLLPGDLVRVTRQRRSQQAQKHEKRLRSRVCRISSSYSGRWVPMLQYSRAALSPPCTDEPRLPLLPGDLVRVTRQRRHWIFGEKILGPDSSEPRGPRGWFPRSAAEHHKPD